MKNMKVSVRPAPSVEEARRKFTTHNTSNSNQQIAKKKPPPRPPPPNFSKMKSKSTWNLDQQPEKMCLIEWSPPNSPKGTKSRTFGGSISSSFSSSTSSLASSKKSFEFDMNPWNNVNVQTSPNMSAKKESTLSNQVQSLMSMPTIIRAQAQSRKKYSKTKDISPWDSPPSIDNSNSTSYSPPMPMIPPPSPPKNVEESILPYGIAIYNFPGNQLGDLPLQINDIVILLRRINNEWLYGRVDDREGMFPASFIDIQVPLPEADDKTVIALYEFCPQIPGDLALTPGQVVRVLHKISNDWLAGESNGQRGQFPANFVDRIPTTL